MPLTLQDDISTKKVGDVPVQVGLDGSRSHRASTLLVLSPLHTLIVMGLCIVFALHCYAPLYSSQLLSDVAAGNWILHHHRVPHEVPGVSLVAGMDWVDPAWLGQVAIARLFQGGAETLRNVTALLALAGCLLLGSVYSRRARSFGIGFTITVLLWSFHWQRFSIASSELLGTCCLALLLSILTGVAGIAGSNSHLNSSEKFEHGAVVWPWWIWVSCPVLLGLWSNLHGSFMAGACIIVCLTVGRATDVLVRTWTVASVLNDREVRRWLLLSELCVAATLVNPYGVDVWLQPISGWGDSTSGLFRDAVPLTIYSPEAISVGICVALTLFALRRSRKQILTSDCLLISMFALTACVDASNGFWFLIVTMWVLAPHLSDIFKQRWSESTDQVQRNSESSWLSRPSRHATLIAGLFIWLAFSLTPVSQTILGGQRRTNVQLFGSRAPWEATQALKQHTKYGMTLSPPDWGDWLLIRGPAEIQPMMTTVSRTIAPQQVWRDYNSLMDGSPGIEQRLNRYRINTVLVEKKQQKSLMKALESLADWQTVYEDDQSLLAIRNRTSVDE